jgi:hypothetical protein
MKRWLGKCLLMIAVAAGISAPAKAGPVYGQFITFDAPKRGRHDGRCRPE